MGSGNFNTVKKMFEQLIVNSIISTSVYLLVALGFAIIYRTVRFFHFAHAAVFTSGAYLTFLFNQIFGLYLYTSILLAIIGASLIGCMMEWLVYKPIRRKKSSSLILLLASLGIYIVLQNVISMVFGDDTKSIRSWEVKEGINLLGAYITPVQIIINVSNTGGWLLVAGKKRKSNESCC
jgi:branched-chain amino acid transport system permease protein